MKVGPSLKIYDIIQALKQKVSQQSSVQEEITSRSQLNVTQVTATGLIKQQGLLQQSPDDKIVSQGSQLLTQHLLKSSTVVQPSRTLQAQPTQWWEMLKILDSCIAASLFIVNERIENVWHFCWCDAPWQVFKDHWGNLSECHCVTVVKAKCYTIRMWPNIHVSN